MKIKGKLTSFSLLSGLVPLVLAAVVASWVASNALQNSSSDRLSSIRDAKAQQVELYFQQIRDQVLTFSGNTMIQDAMVGFVQAFNNHQTFAGFGDQNAKRDAAQQASLERYYQEAFGAKYQQETGQAIDHQPLLPKNPQALALQAQYIADNPHPLGEKHKLDAVKDGSLYERMHGKYHPSIRSYLEQFGYYDIFLIDVETGNIVYSVFKELDFATSLKTGPYANTNFAEAFRQAAAADSPDQAVLVDYARYTPSYEAPASFIASPIFREGKKVGVLVFQMPIDRITEVLSQRTGMGETGEVYLVGEDSLMRSNSRFAESSTILSKKVDTHGTQQALQGQSAVEVFDDDRGVPVLSAFAPVKIDGVHWGILAEIDEAEAFAEVNNLVWLMLGLTLITTAVVAFFSFSFARKLASPIAAASKVAQNITQGSLDNPITASGDDESAELLRALDEMQQDLKQRIQSEEAAAQNERIKSALDAVATPVVATGSDEQVIYINQAAEHLLQQAAPELGTLVGQNIGDAIETVSGAFNAASDNFERRWEHNSRTIDIAVTAVRSDNQTLQGWVLQLIDRTDELAAEAAERERLAEERAIAEANTRIKVALDNASNAVMVADNDGQIIYANEATLSLFRDAEDDIRKDLPDFSADKMVNHSFDQFHKNPSHQRNLLANLQGTHDVEMLIGGRTIRIIANPVIDAEGNRLGTSVQWTDRTQEVAVEQEIDALVEAASAGNLQQRIVLENKSGFFKQLGSGFNRLLDQLASVFGDIGQVVGSLSDGDLRRQIDNQYGGSFQQVADDINNTMANLRDIVGKLNSVSEQVESSAGEIASGNANLSSRTEQQASSLEETASSMEELTATTRQNADNAQQANQVATNARQLAEKGGEVVSSAVQAMDQINTASGKIAEIIGVIDEIAFQTNLLALNASVEAARAGEQGRGFAVVATEVRNLASRSAEAAKEIKELIQDSVNKVQAGSELVHESGETLHEIVNGVKKVGDIVAEISASSAEQASGIDQVNVAVTSMDQMTQQNAALAEQTSAASQEVSQNAVELKKLVNFFRV